MDESYNLLPLKNNFYILHMQIKIFICTENIHEIFGVISKPAMMIDNEIANFSFEVIFRKALEHKKDLDYKLPIRKIAAGDGAHDIQWMSVLRRPERSEDLEPMGSRNAPVKKITPSFWMMLFFDAGDGT